jgi:hypothetical protein
LLVSLTSSGFTRACRLFIRHLLLSALVTSCLRLTTWGVFSLIIVGVGRACQVRVGSPLLSVLLTGRLLLITCGFLGCI